MRNPLALTIAGRLTETWYSSEPPPRLLRGAAALYRRVVRERLQRPTAMPPCPVIVVGNLVAGGSGKTPVVSALAECLADAGYAVSIISRGYGGSGGSNPERVGPDSPAARVGDEALELFRRTGRPVWVCRRRAEALQAAIGDGAGVVISDDGLQHVRLPRSFEICVVDGRRGFGNGYCLPAGPLRQPLQRLDSVDLVLVKRSGGSPSAQVKGIGFELESGELRSIRGNAAPPQPSAEIDALAGIADPAPFFDALALRGFQVRRHALVDHQPITAKILDQLAGPVVMTEKDAVRLPPVSRNDLFVLPVRARLPESVTQRVTGHVREFCA